ncbi:MAG: YbjN domain-containing protein [Kofleriaceae bacterium]
MTQALFANQRETNLTSTLALVEDVLHELGHPTPGSRIDDRGSLHAWQIPKGSALTKVTLISRTEFTHLRVCAVVMTLDDTVDRPALYGHLLDLNATMCGAAFATDGDHILLVSERSTLDLDRSEVLDIIQRVTTFADNHDDVLVARFGGTLGIAAT